MRNVPSVITWQTEAKCSSWWVLNCHGMDAPWAFFDIHQYVPGKCACKEELGQQRAWHWLADSNADRSKLFAIETGNTLNILVYEFVDMVPDLTGK